MTGDSWIEHKTISSEIITILRSKFGLAGSGWIYLGAENGNVDSISVSKAGTWVYKDLNSNSPEANASSPDGFTLTSSTVGSTITVSNMNNGNDLTIFYGKETGSFSYSVNGNASIAVTIDNAGTDIQQKQITLPSGINNFVLTHISGVVPIMGFNLRKISGSGVEISKFGNGSSTGRDFNKISPESQANFSNYLQPDVVVIVLGTNDYRLGHSVADYKLGIAAMIDGYRTENPNCGFILVAPADSNANAVIPLASYRDAIYELAQENNVEFYNMHDDWESYAIANSYGNWADSLHISKVGAYLLAKTLFNKFLEI